MPLYTFKCRDCGELREELRPVAARNDRLDCAVCGARMQRAVELFRVDAFEPYYDEGLGCDVHSASEKRRILKREDLIEIGDKVHGGRNFDAKAPHVVGKSAVKGRPYREKGPARDFPVSTVDASGRETSRQAFSELTDG